MIAFGWSAGDLASAVELIVKVAKAFKESGGATDRFQQTQNFLSGFRITTEHLKRYIESHPDGTYTHDLREQVQSIDAPWKAFQSYLEKYEKSLAEYSHRSRLGKAPRTIQYTINELAGEVSKLETAILNPQNVIGTLLSLQHLYVLANPLGSSFTDGQVETYLKSYLTSYGQPTMLLRSSMLYTWHESLQN